MSLVMGSVAASSCSCDDSFGDENAPPSTAACCHTPVRWAAPSELLAEEEALYKERHAEDTESMVFPDQVKKPLSDDGCKALKTVLDLCDVFGQKIESAATESLDIDTGGGSAELCVLNPMSNGAQNHGRRRKRSTICGMASGGSRAKRTMGKEGLREKEVAADRCVQAEYLPLITATLKPHQLEGVRWLEALHFTGAGCILADDMGMGKTLQAISMMSRLWLHGVRGPFLVVAPLSTLHNWHQEIQRFCPSMPSVVYHGSTDERARLRKAWCCDTNGSLPVVLTSFEVVRRDERHFQQRHWKYMVVDEAHRLKNHNCKLLRGLRGVAADGKLLLTGTPLQNNLSELWSLLNFILPSFFRKLEDFSDWFDFSYVRAGDGAAASDADERTIQEQQKTMVARLHACLRPFLKRRVKAEVLKSLPPKQEMVLWAAMSPLQAQLSAEVAARQPPADEGAGARLVKARLNNVVMQLRKVCNHPELLLGEEEARATGELQYPALPRLLQQAGKLQLLDRILTRLLTDPQRKVIVFSQMTSMLDLLAHFLEQRRWGFSTLDGRMAFEERQLQLQRFDADPACRLFLLSTRAGGLGINLTAADTAVIYDSDWNPQADMQAMDRCHRLGQTRPVLVLRLATLGSVEERILRCARRKLLLERIVIRSGGFGDSRRPARAASDFDDLSTLVRGAGPATDARAAACGAGVTDEMLDRLLDRSYLCNNGPPPPPAQGPGYELVSDAARGLLSSIE